MMKALLPLLLLPLATAAVSAQTTNRTLTYNVSNHTLLWSSSSPLVVPALSWSNETTAIDTRRNLSAAEGDQDGYALMAQTAMNARELFDVPNGDFALRIYDSETTWGNEPTRLGFRSSLGFSEGLAPLWTATNTADVRAVLGFSTNLAPLWNATNAAAVRSSLGIPWAGLTNTNADGLRAALWLSETNDAIFARVQVGGVALSTNGLSGGVVLSGAQAITFVSGASPGPTRTNLGLPWSGLTNTTAPGFRSALDLAATNTPEFRAILLDGPTTDANKTILAAADPTTGTNTFLLPNIAGSNTVLTTGNPLLMLSEWVQRAGFVDQVNLAMASRINGGGGFADLRLSEISLRHQTNSSSFGWAKLAQNLQRNSSSSGGAHNWSMPMTIVIKYSRTGFAPEYTAWALQFGRSALEANPGLPTNKAIGIRQINTNASNNMELFAHNGTNLVATAWTANIIHLEWTSVVLESTGNGTVRLYSTDAASAAGAAIPTLRATLTNGPTGNGPDMFSSMLECWVANTNTSTNIAPFGVSLFIRSAAVIHTNYAP